MNSSLKVITYILLFFASYPLLACSLCTFFKFEQPICQHDKELDFIITKHLLDQMPEILYPLTISPICTLSAHDDFVKNVYFLGQDTLISNSDDKLCIWDIDQTKLSNSTGPTITSGIAAGSLNCIAISPDHTMIATHQPTKDSVIYIWDIQSLVRGQEPHLIMSLAGHTSSISHLKFSSNSDYLLSCSRDQTAKLWELGSKKTVLTLIHHKRFQSVQHGDISNDLTKIITILCSSNCLCLWEKENNFSQPQTIQLPSSDTDQQKQFTLQRAYFIANGSQILILGAQSNRYVYDIATKQLTSLETNHSAGCLHSFNDEENHILINSSEDGTASLCDSKKNNSAQLIFSKHDKALLESHINDDLTLVATGSADKTIKLWHVPDFSDLTIKQALFLRFMHYINSSCNSKDFLGITGNTVMIDFPDKLQTLKYDLQDIFASFTLDQQKNLIHRFFKDLCKLKIFLNIDLKKQMKKEQATSEI